MLITLSIMKDRRAKSQAGSLTASFALPGEDRPLSKAVAAVIAAMEADIIAGRILPGNRLIEDHLMADYAAKRHVVRAALEELERLGVVLKRRHVGAELKRYEHDEIVNLYGMREILHRAAIRGIKARSADDIAGVERWLRIHAEAAASGDLVEVHRTNMMFHNALFELCRNPFLTFAIRHHDWLSFPIRAYGVSDVAALQRACREHKKMLECLRKGDLETLEELAVAHMAPARQIYERKFVRQ